MFFEIGEAERNRAKSPHELFMVNLILFHLLLTPVAIAADIGLWALLLTPLLSGLVILFIWRRARQLTAEGIHEFVALHWTLALARCRLLLIAYGITATLLLLGALAILGTAQESMREIMLVVLTRVGIMPTVIMVFVTFVLESSALYQAVRGELPDGFVRRHRPGASR